MPKVSVIIPVYNVEDYLREALDSVLAQTIDDIEIIAVNDGSKDRSLEILQEYGDKLKIIDKKNGGQAAARNDALDIAAGDYIYFMDSDDWIEPDTLQLCYELCEKDNLDFAFFDAVTFGDVSKPLDYNRTEHFSGIADGPSTMVEMLESHIYTCSVCMSLFRRSFLEKAKARFFPGFIHEDELYSAIVYFNADRVEPLNRAFYHRRFHGGSTMTTAFSKRNVDGYLTVLNKLPQYVNSKPGCAEAKKKLDVAICRCLMDNGWVLDIKNRLRIIGAILRRPWTFRPKPFAVLLFKKFLR